MVVPLTSSGRERPGWGTILCHLVEKTNISTSCELENSDSRDFIMCVNMQLV